MRLSQARVSYYYYVYTRENESDILGNPNALRVKIRKRACKRHRWSEGRRLNSNKTTNGIVEVVGEIEKHYPHHPQRVRTTSNGAALSLSTSLVDDDCWAVHTLAAPIVKRRATRAAAGLPSTRHTLIHPASLAQKKKKKKKKRKKKEKHLL